MDEVLPPGWAWATLGEVCEINPGTDTSHLTPDDEVAFIPMASVSELSSVVDTSKRRPHREVSKGFTRFAPADVIFAKITPCMENGKIALVPEVPGGVAYGSTEFHVIRARPGIDPAYVRHYVSQQSFRDSARAKMSGAVGQQRVPVDFLRDAPIPIAPPAEQAGIANEIHALFTDLDTAEAALGRAREGVEQFRASLLHAACTGALTAAWRAANPPMETGADLLRRILAERRATWERTERARLTAKGAVPKGDAWKARYVEPPDVQNRVPFGLPDGWSLARLAHLVVEGPTNGYSPKASTDGTGTLSLKLTATTRGRIDLGPKAVKQLGETIPAGSNLFLRRGDLLFQRGNTPEYVGISAIYEGPPETYIYPDLLIRVRLSDPKLVRWIWRVANAPSGRKYMQNDASGTAGTMPKITGTTIRNLPVPIPPTAELQQLHSLIDEGEDATQSATAYLDTATLALNNLRQSILHAAFTGRLVPQDPTDEPAAALLARLRAAPAPARRPRGRPVREKASA